MELHDLVGVLVVTIDVKATDILEGQLLAFMLGEVDDDLVTLGHREPEISYLDGLSEEAGVAGNNSHGDALVLGGKTLGGGSDAALGTPALVVGLGSGNARLFEVEVEAPANSSIKEPESIFPRLDSHLRPGDAINQDDVSVYRDALPVCVWRPETAILVELDGGNVDGNIILVAREVERLLKLLVDDVVLAKPAKVGVLGSLFRVLDNTHSLQRCHVK